MEGCTSRDGTLCSGRIQALGHRAGAVMMLYVCGYSMEGNPMYAWHVDFEKGNRAVHILKKAKGRKLNRILHTACGGWILYYTKTSVRVPEMAWGQVKISTDKNKTLALT